MSEDQPNTTTPALFYKTSVVCRRTLGVLFLNHTEKCTSAEYVSGVTPLGVALPSQETPAGVRPDLWLEKI